MVLVNWGLQPCQPWHEIGSETRRLEQGLKKTGRYEVDEGIRGRVQYPCKRSFDQLPIQEMQKDMLPVACYTLAVEERLSEEKGTVMTLLWSRGEG
jgi:hypothetical protein